MADITVEDLQTIEFETNCNNINTLCFQHYGKSSGENGIYDTDIVNNKDCKFQILDIKFDQVSIGEKLKSELTFDTDWTQFQLDNNSAEFAQQFSHIEKTNGMITFNGKTIIQFDTPVYDWLIIKKYKLPIVQGQAFFSNHTMRWHYEKNISIIDEIRKLMKI
jgi:hypothetical protein